MVRSPPCSALGPSHRVEGEAVLGEGKGLGLDSQELS